MHQAFLSWANSAGPTLLSLLPSALIDLARKHETIAVFSLQISLPSTQAVFNGYDWAQLFMRRTPLSRLFLSRMTALSAMGGRVALRGVSLQPGAAEEQECNSDSRVGRSCAGCVCLK